MKDKFLKHLTGRSCTLLYLPRPRPRPREPSRPVFPPLSQALSTSARSAANTSTGFTTTPGTAPSPHVSDSAGPGLPRGVPVLLTSLCPPAGPCLLCQCVSPLHRGARPGRPDRSEDSHVLSQPGPDPGHHGRHPGQARPGRPLPPRSVLCVNLADACVCHCSAVTIKHTLRASCRLPRAAPARPAPRPAQAARRERPHAGQLQSPALLETRGPSRPEVRTCLPGVASATASVTKCFISPNVAPHKAEDGGRSLLSTSARAPNLCL